MAGQSKTAAVNPGAEAKRVLVIKLSALGDFVMALGAMKAVRAHHPTARITLLTTPPFKGLGDLCPYVDVVETDGRPKGAGATKATRALIKRLREADYDIVYDFQTSGRTKNYFTALSAGWGVTPPLWSGHHPKAAFFHANPDRGAMHSVDRLAEQLTYAGVGPADGWDTPPMPDLSWVRPRLENPPRLQPEFFGIEGRYMLLIPGASAHRDAKRWPPERYAELAGKIADAGVTPVVIGATAEGEIAAAMVKAEPRILNLVTRTDLYQIVALAERALFVVGNDTGPMHMATLSGAPGVALFATTESTPERAGPRGARCVHVTAPVLSELDTNAVWIGVRGLDVL